MYKKQLIQKGAKEEDPEVSLLVGEIGALEDAVANKLYKNESGLNKIKGRLSGYQKILDIIKG
ncbi:hypothetical protein HY570_03440 [Candidatus Micrarchaeota archaeon]|nr:hypothetical protein [Candidatus Micrarchaeota archaeon]